MLDNLYENIETDISSLKKIYEGKIDANKNIIGIVLIINNLNNEYIPFASFQDTRIVIITLTIMDNISANMEP